MSSLRHIIKTSRAFKHFHVPSILRWQGFLRSPQLVVIFSRTSLSRLCLQRRGIIFVSDARAKPVDKRYPRNYEIGSRKIMVVQESGLMTGPHESYDVLSNFDFSKRILVMVAEANLEDEGGIAYPICRIMDRATQRNSEMAFLKNKKKKKEVPIKTIEISWAVGDHDLNTKLKRLREFLQKGFKVKILLKAKKKAKPVTLEESDMLIQKIREAVKNSKGKETRPIDGTLLESMEMNFEGLTKSSEKEQKKVENPLEEIETLLETILNSLDLFEKSLEHFNLSMEVFEGIKNSLEKIEKSLNMAETSLQQNEKSLEALGALKVIEKSIEEIEKSTEEIKKSSGIEKLLENENEKQTFLKSEKHSESVSLEEVTNPQ